MTKNTPKTLAQRRANNVQLSPDGKYLIYTAKDGRRKSQIYLRSIGQNEGQNDDRVILSTGKKPIDRYQWSYLPDTLLYVQEKDSGDKHLYSFNVQTNTRRCLTPFVADGSKVSATNLCLSPCNRSEALVGLNLDNPKVHDIYRLNLLTGALELDTKNPGNVKTWETDIALNLRLLNIENEDGSTVLQYRDYYNRVFGPWLTFDAYRKGFGVAVSISALTGKIACLHNNGDDKLYLSSFDPRTQKNSILFVDKKRQFVTLEINPVSREPETVILRKGKLEPIFLNDELKLEYKQLEKVAGKGILICDRNITGDLFLLGQQSKDGKDNYFLFDKKTNQLTTI